MKTYDKIIERHGSELNYMIEIIQERLNASENSLESWRDMTKHTDSDHSGEYNRKHYIDHFYGMVYGYQESLNSLLYLKKVKEEL